MRAVIWPIGPSPKTTTLPPGGHRRELEGLPRRRQDVGEEQEALVGRTLGDLDRPEVRLGDPQQLGLPAGDLAVELRVAEERRALVLLAHLGRLALGEELLAAHPARCRRRC